MRIEFDDLRAPLKLGDEFVLNRESGSVRLRLVHRFRQHFSERVVVAKEIPGLFPERMLRFSPSIRPAHQPPQSPFLESPLGFGFEWCPRRRLSPFIECRPRSLTFNAGWLVASGTLEWPRVLRNVPEDVASWPVRAVVTILAFH